MIGWKRYRSSALTGGMLAMLAAWTLPGIVARAESTPGQVIVGVEREIFANQQAADLVAEARAHDPLYCPRDQADRDEAAQLYERAIAAQPGAPTNAPLADRVAQMYAFYADRKKGIRPDRNKANEWWRRCIAFTGPHQIVWAQAHMGLASMAVMGRDPKAALAAYNKILEIKADQVVLPDWKAWPEDASASSRALLEQEQAQLRESLVRIQKRAVEKVFYVFSRTSQTAAVGVLRSLAAQHHGAPAGDQAAALLAKLQETPGAVALNLPDLTPAQESGFEAPAISPPPAWKQEPPAPAAAQPVAAEASGGGHRGWGIALGTALLAIIVAAALTRRNAFPFQKGEPCEK